MKYVPPFVAGRQAFRTGQPCTPPDMPEGDIYPGARKMWIDGWNTEKSIQEHSARVSGGRT